MWRLILFVFICIIGNISANECKDLYSNANPEVLGCEADELSSSEKDALAFKACTNLANKGDAVSQNILGNMYFDGRGVSLDYAASLVWYRKAADQGNTEAQYNLGYQYENGLGIAQDYNEAFHLYSKAAAKDNIDAMYHLGILYYHGNGIKKNYITALTWLLKAAHSENIYAQYFLGVAYQNGTGVKQDYTEAFKWYSKSADKGYSYSQYALGHMYENGQGVSQNSSTAFEWYSKAADQNNIMAEYKLGKFYQDGSGGVSQDSEKSLQWYTKAAEGGNIFAQYELGNIYYKDGDDQDYRLAFKWYNMAAEGGYDKAKQQLQKMQQNNEINLFDKLSTTELYLCTLMLLFVTAFFAILILEFKPKAQILEVKINTKLSKVPKRLAIIIAILCILPIFSVMSSIAEIATISVGIIILITYFILYLDLDKRFSTCLTKLYFWQCIIGVVIAFLAFITVAVYLSAIKTNTIGVVFFILSYIICFLLMAIILSKTAINIEIIAKNTESHLFGYSASLMKIAAYTIPLLIGFIPLAISRLIFLFACITSDT